MSICAVEEKKRYASSITESIYTSKSSCILQKRKLVINSSAVITNKNNVSEILISAKDKRLKHIRSELTDANFKLTEICKENDILKCVKKRHESALQRYESVSGDIPKMITNQTEEIRFWQNKYKELKKRFTEASRVLHRKKIEFNKLTEDYEYLVSLSKEENLGELDDLQNQVQELTQKLEKQQQTIDCLQRRLVLDEKAHKQKLNLERERRKEMMSQQSDESVHQNCISVQSSVSEEKKRPDNETSNLPSIQRNISKFKAIISEMEKLPVIPSYICRNTMIPRLHIPIPETDKESSSDESIDEKSYRTRTLTRRSDSCMSDIYMYDHV